MEASHRNDIPHTTHEWLNRFCKTSAFKKLQEEYAVNNHVHQIWKDAPYPPTFITTDVVTIQSGHVLLIRRGNYPFKGCYALPGGYLDIEETIEDSALRELREETHLHDHLGEIPPAKLRSMITAKMVFDDVHRDPRGRTISHAFLIRLPDSTSLYKVRGGDDAASAHWVPLSAVRANEMAFDHYAILRTFLGELS